MRIPRTAETVPYLLPGIRTILRGIKICALPQTKSLEIKRQNTENESFPEVVMNYNPTIEAIAEHPHRKIRLKIVMI